MHCFCRNKNNRIFSFYTGNINESQDSTPRIVRVLFKEVTIMSSKEKWSQTVTGQSDVLELEEGVFKKEDPHEIAVSLKKSAEQSNKKKRTPYQSAMSMLTFYINRGGSNFSKKRKKILEKTKNELRKVFDRKAS